MPRHMILGLVLLAGCSLPPADGDSIAATADREIPLKDAVFSYPHQPGLQRLDRSLNSPTDKEYNFGSRVHFPAIFLVRTETIVGAVRGSRLALKDGAFMSLPVKAEDKPTDQFWLAFLMGSGSPSQPWIAESIHIKGNVIEVSYHQAAPPPGGYVLESALFMVWAPLGKLPGEKYVLRMRDSRTKKVVCVQEVLMHLNYEDLGIGAIK